MLLGASAVLSNGTVLSRAGCAIVAGAAAAAARPVIICCETYKFAERVLLDSITLNELGDPAALAAVPLRSDLTALDGWAAQPHLSAPTSPAVVPWAWTLVSALLSSIMFRGLGVMAGLAAMQRSQPCCCADPDRFGRLCRQAAPDYAP